MLCGIKGQLQWLALSIVTAKPNLPPLYEQARKTGNNSERLKTSSDPVTDFTVYIPRPVDPLIRPMSRHTQLVSDRSGAEKRRRLGEMHYCRCACNGCYEHSWQQTALDYVMLSVKAI